MVFLEAAVVWIVLQYNDKCFYYSKLLNYFKASNMLISDTVINHKHVRDAACSLHVTLKYEFTYYKTQN